ncbi:hypothetical protein ACROYT_G021895 [Oculina patagonica]
MSDGKLLKTEAPKNEKLCRPNSSFTFGSSIEENSVPSIDTIARLEAKVNRNQTGGDRKTSPFYEEINSVLGCRDIVTFSHVEESSPIASGTSLRSPGSSNDNNEKDDEEIDEEFEQSLAVFGLNKKRERKSQRRDERKRAKTAKATRKERDEDDDLFRESMEKLQAQGDKLTNVLEAMEKNQTQQLQIMNQFMNNFMQAMQSKSQE